MNAIVKAERERRREQNHQRNIIFPCMFTILWEKGWDADKIMERVNDSVDAMKCGYTQGLSVLEVLEEETGIEMTLDGEKSYHEFAYFSADTQVKPLNAMQEVYVIHRTTKWIPTLMLAGICVALHRKDGWEYDELSDFIEKMNAIRSELGEDESRYADYMTEKTGYKPKEMWRV